MTPIYILAGQSNAVAIQAADSYRKRILEAEPDAIIVQVSEGATSIFPDSNRNDWYAANDGNVGRGELFTSLVSQIRAALEANPDAYIAGMGWVQGESDSLYGYAAYYESLLGQMQDRLAEIFGEFPLAVMALADNAPVATGSAGWKQVQDAQIALAESDASVTLLDPDDLGASAGLAPSQQFYDNVHYSNPMLQVLGDALADHLLNIDANNGPQEPTQVNVGAVERSYVTKYGTAKSENLIGTAGHDKLFGQSGNDTVYGGDGDDQLAGSDGADTLYGNSGYDYLWGGNHNDLMYGGTGNDTLDGFSSVDLLVGEAGDDFLLGGDGNDTLLGGEGSDINAGGAGADNFVFHGNSGSDVVNDFNHTQDILTLVEVASAQDITKGSDAEGNLVLTWDFQQETHSVTLLGLRQQDFDALEISYGW